MGGVYNFALENTTPTNTNRAIRIAAHRTQGLQGANSVVLGGRSDHQRTLVVRIAAITIASDSAITIARLRPSKERRYVSRLTWGGGEM